MAYAQKINNGERGERSLRYIAVKIWRETTKDTTYFVSGS